ncbi:phospho-N-acetylmuramoyl-pentapeptide-transferase [Hymenobacter sp. ASUV-10]|uniref:Phospho-N-acetylmuramoyl-pentapeptide-transferase n=1 Tax=Hymenobacter aranciens TaxID=3063996 RepID=A0ABT9BJ47_9BACT|nr:phospho-N-acetylmuramoyl-pentapeptide-transferase [Hymenobacter sp. ASUV-10]MDO7876671.1 phospho-N-acetylmuramoyl-pentapeptide-transferase [Hymenobacter sp. ASUV-10]
MLYYLFRYLHEHFHIPGLGVFQYTTFRAALAIVVSLLIAQTFGHRLIRILQRKQVGEDIRDLGLQGQLDKKGTPTMGGLIILLAILVPVLLFARLRNIYIILMILSTVWLGLIGFLDDYIKVFRKNKEGLSGRFKILGQVGLGITVGWVLFFSNEITIRQYLLPDNTWSEIDASKIYRDVHLMITTVPFMKNNELNYGDLFATAGDMFNGLYSVLYIPIVIFLITAISNGANLTDGLDGLAAGTSAIIGVTLAIFAFVSGNALLADYLDVMFIPDSGELVIFCTAFVGACIGFLWYNSFPAQVFMGDTGSLALGGIITVLALIVRKELLIPILCGVFIIENLSVVVQVTWFKYTKRKYGEGRRLLRMSPLHHHYQKLGYHESKIVSRFWIVGIMLAVITLVTLKLR